MDRTHTIQLLNLGRNIILITVAMLTGHCVMERHAERMQLAFNDFCLECRSAVEEFLVSMAISCQVHIKAIWLFNSCQFDRATDVKYIASFIKLWQIFQRRVVGLLMCSPCAYQLLLLLPQFARAVQGLCSHVVPLPL